MRGFTIGAPLLVALGLFACDDAATDDVTASTTSTSASGLGGSTSGSTGSTTGSSASGTGGGGAAICPGAPYAASPLPANPTVTPVQGGFDFLEGPVWFADTATLYFSDMHFNEPNDPPLNGPRSTIHQLVGGSVSDFIENGSTNGLGITLDGELIACTHDTRSVSRIDRATKARTNVADAYTGKKFNSPNDVVVRSDGNVYFTDPDWQLSGMSQLPMAAYRVTPGGAVEVVDLLGKPNGIALSPDEKTLYVGAADGKIRSYAVGPDGATGPASDFASVNGPDGMAVDCAGNVYVTGGPQVAVFTPEGAPIGTITGMAASATNAAFGGPARTTLYVTAGDTLYSIELAIPGYPY